MTETLHYRGPGQKWERTRARRQQVRSRARAVGFPLPLQGGPLGYLRAYTPHLEWVLWVCLVNGEDRTYWLPPGCILREATGEDVHGCYVFDEEAESLVWRDASTLELVPWEPSL